MGVDIQTYRARIGGFCPRGGAVKRTQECRISVWLACVISLALLLSGDVESNPGPRDYRDKDKEIEDLKEYIATMELRHQKELDNSRCVYDQATKVQEERHRRLEKNIEEHHFEYQNNPDYHRNTRRCLDYSRDEYDTSKQKWRDCDYAYDTSEDSHDNSRQLYERRHHSSEYSDSSFCMPAPLKTSTPVNTTKVVPTPPSTRKPHNQEAEEGEILSDDCNDASDDDEDPVEELSVKDFKGFIDVMNIETAHLKDKKVPILPEIKDKVRMPSSLKKLLHGLREAAKEKYAKLAAASKIFEETVTNLFSQYRQDHIKEMNKIRRLSAITFKMELRRIQMKEARRRRSKKTANQKYQKKRKERDDNIREQAIEIVTNQRREEEGTPIILKIGKTPDGKRKVINIDKKKTLKSTAKENNKTTPKLTTNKEDDKRKNDQLPSPPADKSQDNTEVTNTTKATTDQPLTCRQTTKDRHNQSTEETSSKRKFSESDDSDKDNDDNEDIQMTSPLQRLDKQKEKSKPTPRTNARRSNPRKQIPTPPHNRYVDFGDLTSKESADDVFHWTQAKQHTLTYFPDVFATTHYIEVYTKHNLQDYTECTFEEKYIPGRNMQGTRRVYTCNDCYHESGNRTDAWDHVVAAHLTEYQIFCVFCKEHFKNRRTAERHVKDSCKKAELDNAEEIRKKNIVILKKFDNIIEHQRKNVNTLPKLLAASQPLLLPETPATTSQHVTPEQEEKLRSQTRRKKQRAEKKNLTNDATTNPESTEINTNQQTRAYTTVHTKSNQIVYTDDNTFLDKSGHLTEETSTQEMEYECTTVESHEEKIEVEEGEIAQEDDNMQNTEDEDKSLEKLQQKENTAKGQTEDPQLTPDEKNETPPTEEAQVNNKEGKKNIQEITTEEKTEDSIQENTENISQTVEEGRNEEPMVEDDNEVQSKTKGNKNKGKQEVKRSEKEKHKRPVTSGMVPQSETESAVENLLLSEQGSQPNNEFVTQSERSSFEQEMVETARKNNHIVTNGGHVIYKKSIFDLLHEKFIDDWIIDLYLQLVEESVPQKHMFRFLAGQYALMRDHGYDSMNRMRPLPRNLFDYKNIVVPCNLGHGGSAHWTLTVVVPKKREILQFDSLGDPKGRFGRRVKHLLYEFAKRNNLQYRARDIESYSVFGLKDLPLQHDSVDCGAFVMKYAEHFIRNIPNDFKQENMPQIRSQILYNIVKGKLHNFQQ